MKVEINYNDSLMLDVVQLTVHPQQANIHAIVATIERENSQLKGKRGDKIFRIDPDICYSIYSSNKNIYAKTVNDEYLLKTRLYELESLLPKQFIRISNTEIINLNEVDYVELTKNGLIEIVFNNGNQTTSSRRYLKKIKECLL